MVLLLEGLLLDGLAAVGAALAAFIAAIVLDAAHVDMPSAERG
jgi:hypothetical protein